ncbi:hypothetical protein [Actinomadura sp. 9N215]|uniref:hypothetical protein n=1 Tax=Actinomadura sp. 9N215 TaxID=3375150 RepID=UPI0037927562
MPAFACAAVAACAALTSCGDGSEKAGPSPSSPAPTPSASSTASPAKDSPADEKLVLRWRTTGGIGGVGGPGSVPDFSLYSTGRAVVSSGGPQGSLTEYRLKPEALQRLLDEARKAGLHRSHTVGSDQVMDAIIIVVTLGDATSRVMQPGSEGSPEAAFLKRLDAKGWAASDQAASPKPYTPSKTAVLAGETSGGGTVRKWPLGPLGEGQRKAGGICTLAPSAKVPAAKPDVTWRSEGKTYSVRLRPLLPAESSCRDIA